MENIRSHYIYKITNKLNGKNYIGQRTCPLCKTPETDSYMGSGILIEKAERKYGLENFEKKIIIKNIISIKEINRLEIYYINLYRKFGQAQYNIADGGTKEDQYQSEKFRTKKSIGMKLYYKQHPELREWQSKHSKIIMNTPERRKKQQMITKERMSKPGVKKQYSDAMKERYKNPEWHKITGDATRKALAKPEIRQKLINFQRNRSKPWKQKKVFCQETNTIYKSISEAGKQLKLSNWNSISKCCCGKQEKAYGYHWCFA
jgi:hypothetical protein